MATIEELQRRIDSIDEAIDNANDNLERLSRERFLVYQELEKERDKIAPTFEVKIFQREASELRTTEMETLKECLSFIEKSIKENNKIYYISIDINKDYKEEQK